MLDLEEIQVFIAVAQAESFVGAAQQLEMPTSTVSRRISSLEEGLEARLFQRTTRSVTLTDVGRAFVEQARQLVEHAAEAEQSVRKMAAEPTGRLRVTAPILLCHTVLAPVVSEWTENHPGVEADVVSTDRVVDLIAEGYDVAIRGYPKRDTGLIARKLDVGLSILVASPEYLDTHGRPECPSDLADHECILFNFAHPGDLWTVGGEDISVSGRMSTNDPVVALEWARAHHGIARTGQFIAREAINRGDLELVLPEVAAQETKLAAVYPSSRHLSPKVRTFVDLLVERMSDGLFG